MTWQEDEIEITVAQMTWDAQWTIRSIYEAAGGAVNAFSNVHRSKERLHAAFDYVFRHGTYPSSVILAVDEGGYEVLDGYHRLAALHFAGVFHAQGIVRDEAAKIQPRHNVVVATLPADWND